eukprot:CAMPEP_0114362930 /NCGR_PEP_ID=MMETSP0101-20121206/26101_1 /TAXON_ID=38822 ORGANISM="Pteridomonas danica, Strain PT" /NCGR_SAMPLE_ID=MMETSP0101 /ASSEMBLY_ACC=CAM_ASM_000211 /LENGTH=115 /DNA_ID=CAMNT_0001509149 /DNA_START=23 /DNA_END=370 /DNA_ORIENTATION=-
MEGEDDGVAFTPDDAYPLVISFHTKESHTARIGLQAAWSEYRSANTSKQRNSAMKKAQRLASAVKVPTGARTVQGPKWLRSAMENVPEEATSFHTQPDILGLEEVEVETELGTPV